MQKCKKTATTTKNELQTCDWVMRKNTRILTVTSGCFTVLHSIMCSFWYSVYVVRVYECVGFIGMRKYKLPQGQIIIQTTTDTSINVSVCWFELQRARGKRRAKKKLCDSEGVFYLCSTLHHLSVLSHFHSLCKNEFKKCYITVLIIGLNDTIQHHT